MTEHAHIIAARDAVKPKIALVHILRGLDYIGAHTGVSAEDLQHGIRVSFSSASTIIRILRDSGEVYVDKYRTTPGGGTPTALYCKGNKKGAVRPKAKKRPDTVRQPRSTPSEVADLLKLLTAAQAATLREACARIGVGAPTVSRVRLALETLGDSTAARVALHMRVAPQTARRAVQVLIEIEQVHAVEHYLGASAVYSLGAGKGTNVAPQSMRRVEGVMPNARVFLLSDTRHVAHDCIGHKLGTSGTSMQMFDTF